MELTGNLYELFRSTTTIHEFINKYPFEKIKKYYDSINKDIDYRYFVCLLEKDINYAIKYHQNNEEFMHELMKVSDDIYSIFGYAKYDSIDIIFRYLIKNKEDLELFSNSISHLDSNDLYKYIRLSNDEEIISYILNRNIMVYKKFVMEDERAIYFINNKLINVKIVEYPDYLKNNNIIFESLKNYSITQFRNNIEEYSNINKSYFIQEKMEKYEDYLINSFNPNTNLFDVEDTSDRYLHMQLKIEEEQASESKRKFNELIIDRLFKDNYNNVIINIKEILRYASKASIISEETIELYNSIINFKDLSYEEKIKIYNKYKDQKLYIKFYLDILNCKKDLYQKIKGNLYIPKVVDKQLSSKYNKDIYCLDGENFSMLIRTLNSKFSIRYGQERECFSLINNDNTSRFDGSYVYGYNDFDIEKIISINEYDAYSSKNGETDYPNRLMTVDELASKKNYNEIQIQTNNVPLKPTYVVSFNEIKDEDIYESDRLGIPIVLIKEENYNKKNLNGNMFEEREKYTHSVYNEFRGHTL